MHKGEGLSSILAVKERKLLSKDVYVAVEHLVSKNKSSLGMEGNVEIVKMSHICGTGGDTVIGHDGRQREKIGVVIAQCASFLSVIIAVDEMGISLSSKTSTGRS